MLADANFYNELKDAASQMVTLSDPEPLLKLYRDAMEQAYSDGYDSAIQILIEHNAETKTKTDPSEHYDLVKSFLEYLFARISWKCMPAVLLQLIFKGWYKKTHDNVEYDIGRNEFLLVVRCVLPSVTSDWFYSNSAKRPGKRMSEQEPLFQEYDIDEEIIEGYYNGNGFRGLFKY